MLVKAGSKLYIAGEYAILSNDAYALISYIDKYTYAKITKSDKLEILTKIEDKDNIIEKTIEYMFSFFKKRFNFKIEYFSELYENETKYGLGSSASIMIVTIKAMFEFLNIKYTKDLLFKLAKDIKIKNMMSGSFGDIACICYEKTILFKSDKNIEKIKVINLKSNLLIKAIWTQIPAKTSKLIKNVDIHDSRFKKFKKRSNDLVLRFEKNIKKNNINKILDIVNKLNDNLIFLNETFKLNMFPNKVKEILQKYPYTKTSGAGGGDFILNFEKNSEKKIFKIYLEKI